MKIPLITLLLIPVVILVSCKKPSKQDEPIVKVTNDIIVPQNFTWENSRTIIFTVNVTDARFNNAMHVLSIYDGDPKAGGNLLAKGSATVLVPFKSSIYLSKQLTQVYLVKNSPDNIKTTQIIYVKNDNVDTSIGL